MKERGIYLDHAAATPVDPRVLRVYVRALSKFANPSSIHSLGHEVKRRIENNRGKIASIFGIRDSEVVFTSGATESNNIILQGLVRSAQKNGINTPHIISSSIEHDSTKEVLRALEKEGAEITFLDPDTDGIVAPKAIKKALRPDTIVVAISHVHSELGSIAPIKEYARNIRAFRSKRKSRYPILHVDASQSLTSFSANEVAVHADTLSADGSKIYSVRGSGVAIIRSQVPVDPILFGGGQEQGLRPGTENSAAIMAFTEALSICNTHIEEERSRLRELSDSFVEELLERVSSARINSPEGDKRASHMVNICFPGVEAEFLLISLDARDIYASRGSACKERNTDASEAILKTSGIDCAASSIRFSFGRDTRKKDIKKAVSVIDALLNSKNLNSKKSGNG